VSASAGRPRTSELRRRFDAAHAKLKTVAVTGTNGKTSTVSMVAAIVAAAGEPHARLTTVGAWVNDVRIEGAKSAQFLGTVERAVAAGVRTLALETTSKSLAGGLAQRWPAHVAIFTNLTRDHLDMHGTPEAYLASKAQLFLHAREAVVLNADDPSSALLAEVVPAHTRVLRYGSRDADLLYSAEVSREGTRIRARGILELDLQMQVHGRVHAANASAAALGAHAAGYEIGAIEAGLEAFEGAPGRFEIVRDAPLAIVDYAHTPDALRGTLETARALTDAAVWLVFGCGGERDQGKRAPMGAVADAMADQVVLTNDNPRREDPEAIAAAVREGAIGRAQWHTELDRRAAIARALGHAGVEDVVVVAGKGHEATQQRGTEAYTFDDVEIIRTL